MIKHTLSLKSIIFIKLCCLLFNLGCTKYPESTEVFSLIKNDFQDHVRQYSPSQIKIYIDISGSMVGYLNVPQSSQDYRNFIFTLFNSRGSIPIEMFGFGDTLLNIGNNLIAQASVLNAATFSHQHTNIQLAFDHIQQDTTRDALYIVLTDARQDDPGERLVQYTALGDAIKNSIGHGRLFSFLATRFPFQSQYPVKFISDYPFYAFVFGRNEYLQYIDRALYPLFQHHVTFSPSLEYEVKFRLSDNVEQIWKSKRVSCVQINNYADSLHWTALIEQPLSINRKSELMLKPEELSVIESSKTLSSDGEYWNITPEWSRKQPADFMSSLKTVASPDSQRYTIRVNLSGKPAKKSEFTLYHFQVVPRFPDWIQAYSTDDANDLRRTPGLQNFFPSLRSQLSFDEIALYDFYLLIK